MWIPQVIFCVGTAVCQMASAPEQPTEEACRAYIAQTMIPLILYAVPNVMIFDAACEPAGTPV